MLIIIIMCQQEWQAVRMEQVVQARSPGHMELDIVLCLQASVQDSVSLAKPGQSWGSYVGAGRQWCRRQKPPGVRGSWFPSSEKKEVKLQGPVTSSAIGKIVLFLGATDKWRY